MNIMLILTMVGGKIPGTFPKAAKQIRIDVIRHIVSHLEKLQVHGEGTERFLHAAAQLYGIQISVFEVSQPT